MNLLSFQSIHINTLIDSVYQVSPIYVSAHEVVLTPALLIQGLGLGTQRAAVLLKAEAPAFRQLRDSSLTPAGWSRVG